VVPSSGARFGTATQRLTLDGADPRKLETDVAAIRAWFGTVELIGHRQVAIPGSIEALELRAQDPRGAYGKAMLALLEGRWPSAAGEVALTTRRRRDFRSASVAPSAWTARTGGLSA
jgi:putative ABC transport system permease protein